MQVTCFVQVILFPLLSLHFVLTNSPTFLPLGLTVAKVAGPLFSAVPDTGKYNIIIFDIIDSQNYKCLMTESE